MTNFISHFDELVSQEAAEVALGRTMDIWVRGEEISVYEVEMPDVPQRKWMDMVPWLLEDQLLRPAEELHFSFGPELPDNRVLVYVVAKECMNRWLMMAESKAVSPQKFAPDYLALPIEDGYWTLSIQGSRLLVRTGPYQGFAADLTLGWQLLGMQLNKAEGIRVAALVEDSGLVPEEWRDRVQVQQGELNWGFIELPQINLLTGEYRPTTAREIKPWYPSIGLGAVALLLVLVYLLVQSFHWQKDVQILDAGIAEVYQELFSESWQGPRTAIRSATEERLRLLEHQYIALQTSPIAELRAMDSGLSSCASCDLQLVRQTGDSVSFTLKPTDALRSRLVAVPDINLDWGAPDEEGVLLIEAALEAGGG